MSQADGKNPAILVFHGVPDLVHPWVNLKFALFREYMKYLKDSGCRVCSLRDWFADALPENAGRP